MNERCGRKAWLDVRDAESKETRDALLRCLALWGVEEAQDAMDFWLEPRLGDLFPALLLRPLWMMVCEYLLPATPIDAHWRRSVGSWYFSLGVMIRKPAPTEALRCWARSFELCGRVSSAPLVNRSLTESSLGRYETALADAAAADSVRRDNKQRDAEGWICLAKAVAFAGLGQPELALESAQKGLMQAENRDVIGMLRSEATDAEHKIRRKERSIFHSSADPILSGPDSARACTTTPWAIRLRASQGTATASTNNSTPAASGASNSRMPAASASGSILPGASKSEEIKHAASFASWPGWHSSEFPLGPPPEGALSRWSAEEAARWLHSVAPAFERYADCFFHNGIDGATLLVITDRQLSEIGVSKSVHRAKLLRAIGDRHTVDQVKTDPKNDPDQPKEGTTQTKNDAADDQTKGKVDASRSNVSAAAAGEVKEVKGGSQSGDAKANLHRAARPRSGRRPSNPSRHAARRSGSRVVDVCGPNDPRRRRPSSAGFVPAAPLPGQIGVLNVIDGEAAQLDAAAQAQVDPMLIAPTLPYDPIIAFLS